MAIVFKTYPTSLCFILLSAYQLDAQGLAQAADVDALQRHADHIESLLSQSTPAPRPDVPQLRTSREPARYRLNPGDIVSLKFPLAPEFDQPLISVMPDGFVALNGAGDVWLAGKSLPEAKVAIEEVYGRFLREPEVTITLDEYEKPYFIAFGQVGTPGKYELVDQLTAAQAVGVAGGFAEGARKQELVVLRGIDGNWTQVLTVDVKAILRGGELAEDITLRPGDMLFVPKTAISDLKEYIPRLGIGIGIGY